VNGRLSTLLIFICIILLFSIIPAQAELVKKGFVTCWNNDVVYVIDPNGVNQSSQIDAGNRPTDIAVDSSGTHAYVINYGSCDVSVLDLASNNVVGRIPLRSNYHPVRIVADTNRNYAYVAANFTDNPSDCIISVINMNTGLESKVIDTEIYNAGSGGVDAMAVVYSSGTPYLFITHYFDNQLVVYNLNTYSKVGAGAVRISHNYTVGQTYPVLAVSDIAVSDGGTNTYIAHGKNVSMFRTAQIVQAATVGATYIADRTLSTGTLAGEVDRLQVDTARLSVYLACDSGSVAIVDDQISAIKVTVPVGSGPKGMAIDNSTLYVCDSDNSYISVVDIVKQVEVGRIRMGSSSMPTSIAIRTVDVPAVTPTPTPTPLPVPTLNVTVAPNPVVAGSDTQVRVTVMNGTAPLKSSNIRISSTGGTLRSYTGVTTSDGVFITNFTAGSAGRYDLTISANTSGYQDQSTGTVVNVNPAAAKKLDINVTIDPETVTVGSEASIMVKVTDGGLPVPDATVNFISTGGRVTKLIPLTASDGVCYAKFTSNASGSFVLTVTVNKTGYTMGSVNAVVSVEPATVSLLTMNVTVMPQPIVLGNESVITVVVMNGSQPVNGARVDLTSTSGSITPLSGVTTADGKFLARLKARLVWA